MPPDGGGNGGRVMEGTRTKTHSLGKQLIILNFISQTSKVAKASAAESPNAYVVHSFDEAGIGRGKLIILNSLPSSFK